VTHAGQELPTGSTFRSPFRGIRLWRMRVLLTGSTGFLGSECLALLRGIPEIMVSTLRTNPGSAPAPSPAPNQYCCTPISPEALTRTIKVPPTHIFHLGALASPERCEVHPEEAHYSNIKVTEALASYARGIGAHLIMTSTDLVFDGLRTGIPGGITEECSPQPVSVYSSSKRSAEEITLGVPKGTVVRLSLLYGRSPANALGTTAWMEQGFQEKREVTLFYDEFRTPIHVRDAAAFLLKVACDGLTGVWHCGGPERLSRVEFGSRIAAALGCDAPRILKVSRLSHKNPPQRPEDVSLNSERLWSATGILPRTVADALSPQFEDFGTS
jgi:dTDP-4-dehydrorhamnose reductase